MPNQKDFYGLKIFPEDATEGQNNFEFANSEIDMDNLSQPVQNTGNTTKGGNTASQANKSQSVDSKTP